MRWVALPVLGLLACTPSVPRGITRQSGPSDRVDENASVRAPPAGAPSPMQAPVAYSLGQIGWDAVPKVSSAARGHNRKALRAHRNGDYAASRSGFTKALEASAAHDMARFNLACAHSRLGELEKAKLQFLPLLERDLLRFQGRWRGPLEDPDLEALRTSDHATSIDDAIAALRLTFDAAQDAGIPAYVYRRTPFEAPTTAAAGGTEPDDAVSSGGASGLVVGVYLPNEHRFVPLTRGENLALLDLPTRRVVHVQNSHTAGWYEPTIDDPLLVLRSTSPDPAMQFETRLTMSSKELGMRIQDEATLGFVQHLTLAWTPETLAFELWYPHPMEGIRSRTGSIELDGTHHFDRLQLKDHPRLEIILEGAVQQAPKAPRPKRTKRVRAADYESVIPSPDGRYTVVVRQRHATDANDAHNDATIDRVDLSTGEATRISQGQGAGWALFDRDGALYVEAGGVTQRWATVDAATPEPTLTRMHIAMPRDAEVCNLCG